MDELPKDPAMLMSFLNMKLRDNYQSLDELCDDLGIDRQELLDQMKKLGMEYLRAEQILVKFRDAICGMQSEEYNKQARSRCLIFRHASEAFQR